MNNAGCNVRKPALDVTWDDWNLVLDTNLRGSFFVAQAVARGMIEHGYGRIINIGSVTSVFGFAGLGPYCASRGGIRQLTMSLADDWGKHGITVNCLAPGWFNTEQNKVLYEDPEWVDVSDGSHSGEAAGPAARSGWRGGISGFRGEPLHHRADPAGGWRHFDRRNARDRSEAKISRALLTGCFSSADFHGWTFHRSGSDLCMLAEVAGGFANDEFRVHGDGFGAGCGISSRINESSVVAATCPMPRRG